MPKRKNPQTSLDAYRNLDPTRLAEIYVKIIESLKIIKEGNFEDIADHMKVKPEKIWKRLSELARAGLIHRTSTRKTLRSGDTGFTWKPGPRTEKIEKVMPGDSISEYSKKLTQQNLF